MDSSSSQPEIEADGFLESMSAVLSPKLKTQPTQGPSSVREHSTSAPFVSPPGRMNASSSMPTVAEPNKGPPRSGSAKAIRMASMLPGTFKAQLAVRGNAPPPMMHGQGFGLGPSIPASEVWNGFVYSQTGAPFAPAPSGSSPFGNLQPGGVPGFKPNLAAVPQLVAGNTGHQDAEQVCLVNLVLEVKLLTIYLAEISWVSYTGHTFGFGCPVLLWHTVCHGKVISTVSIQIRRQKRETGGRTASDVRAHHSGRGRSRYGLYGQSGCLSSGLNGDADIPPRVASSSTANSWSHWSALELGQLA